MTLEEFMQNVDQNVVPRNKLLQALYHDKKGDWNTAHQIIQDINSKAAARIHAYLHREEGDLPNAGYWYSRASAERYTGSLNDEWTALVVDLLKKI